MPSPVFFNLPEYLPKVSDYTLLPFFFTRLNNKKILLTNDLGEHKILTPEIFDLFVQQKLDSLSIDYLNLRAKYFLTDIRSSLHSRIMASKLRTKKSFLDGFTKLHIFVVTLRCDHSCPYCQVSRQSEDKLRYDMTVDMAHRSVDLMFQTPAQSITCEFQGGEPLLNFELVMEIVRYTEGKNQTINKSINFVVCTNISTLSTTHLEFCKTHNISISTSLDGPDYLHDKNRPFCRGSSHAVVERNIRLAQEALGVEQISVLMTTTRDSLRYPREIIDEYLRLDLGSIFLRSISPYGFAVKTMKSIGYSFDEFFQFYKTALSYIIDINKNGQSFSEGYTALILTKILTPFPIGYVDLQSPSGAGFGVVVYNYDGEVYVSDEARMLAEMNDTNFRLGNVLENSYEEIFFGDRMKSIAAASCNESLAGCADCAFQPYCGADPIFHYATQGDMFGNRASSEFCKKNMAIFHHIFELLQLENPELTQIFWSWINQTSVEDMKVPEVPWPSN